MSPEKDRTFKFPKKDPTCVVVPEVIIVGVTTLGGPGVFRDVGVEKGRVVKSGDPQS